MDAFAAMSTAIAERVAASAGLVAGVAGRIAGIAWRPGVVVTSDQALPEGPEFQVSVAGEALTATLTGRDPGTNVAVLRTGPDTPGAPQAATARVGSLALALGEGGTARLACLSAVGPEWTSMAGGRIEARLRLSLMLARGEEGGPVVDAGGGLLGMATAGPRGQGLVIPHATIARVLPALLAGETMRRGWLGVGLQPVAVPEALRAAAGMEAGMMVVTLAEGGPCVAAGILPGDILLSLDGQALARARRLSALLAAERIGSEVAVTLVRSGAVMTVAVTIRARP